MQDYREFRKRCEIYRKKMQIGNRQSEVVYNLVTLMSGKSWDLVEDMTMDQMAADNAYDLLFERLDRGFKYDPLTELPDDFEQYFVRLQRKPHQTLQDYMNDYTRCERRLQMTHSVNLPEKVRAWWFLRRSGITKEQRQLILTNTGTGGLTIEEVMKSMSFILGQDSTLQSTSSSRWSRPPGKPVDTYYCDEDQTYDWAAGSDEVVMDPSPAYYGEDYDWDDWQDGATECAEDIAFVDHCEQVYDVDEFDDVFANYQDAKAKMNALRNSRGFYPVVAMLPPHVSGQSQGGQPRGKSSGKSKSKSKDEPHQVLLPEDTESHVGEHIDGGIQQLLDEVMVAEDTLDVSQPRQSVLPATTRQSDGKDEQEIGAVKRLHGHVLRKLQRQAEEACRVEDKMLQQGQSIDNASNAPGGKSRSSMAEDYPERLAKKLAQLMQADPDETPVLAAEDEDVDMPEVGKAAMNYVVRLHRNLGHPGSNVLCKMLEEVQATENVMTEYELEDLMNDENEEYEPTEPPSDQEARDDAIPEDEIPGAVLMYQNRRSEEMNQRPNSSASPSTEVPECPSIAGDDQEMKREMEDDIQESALKRARKAADIPDYMKKVMPVTIHKGLDDLCLLCFSDAAFNVRSDGSSQGGYIVVLTSQKALSGQQVPYNVLSWRSFKLIRVCRSSLSAESQACSTALDELMMVRSMLAMMLNPQLDPMAEATAAECGKSAIIIDAKALYDSLKKDGIGSSADKRAGIEILCIKEEIKRLKTELRWVSSERMLADGLTKIHARQQMTEMLKSGWLSIVHDESYTAAKKKNKEERQASTANTFGYTNQVAARISMVVALNHVAEATTMDNTQTEGEELGVVESAFFNYAFFVTALSLLLGVPMVAYGIYKCMCRLFQFIKYLYYQERLITMLRLENLELKEEAENSRKELARLRTRLVRMRVGLCFYTEGGTRWHVFNDCRSFRASSRVLNKDGLCRVCWERLQDETAGEDKIMQTNPVLESFGNAMTVRNNNSSRFGKWLQMTVSPSLSIESCTVTDYLLELTRVCSQGSKERNYHIFFQLIDARQSDELKSLGIMEAKDYAYLKNCLAKAPGIDDSRFFEELKDAFQGLGIGPKLQLEVFSIVAGLLLMGNVEFAEEGEAAKLTDESDSAPIKKASQVLGLELEALKSALLKRLIKVGKDVTAKPRTAPQARATADAVARLLRSFMNLAEYVYTMWTNVQLQVASFRHCN
ncbi:unnamed protein product [Durusdinium trenchii]|uniref:Myosin motor domain-containing protein n=1 Tax=Durusdinium trenchii TaxID=1381693 RepID=A0ABP0RJZ6_9DINO